MQELDLQSYDVKLCIKSDSFKVRPMKIFDSVSHSIKLEYVQILKTINM